MARRITKYHKSSKWYSKSPWNELNHDIPVKSTFHQARNTMKNCLSHDISRILILVLLRSRKCWTWQCMKMSNVPKAMAIFWEDQQKSTPDLFWILFSFLLSHLVNFSMGGYMFPYFLITLEIELLAIQNFISYTLVIAGLKMKMLF